MLIAQPPRAFDALRAAIQKIEAGGRAPKGFLPFGLEVLDRELRLIAQEAVHHVLALGSGGAKGKRLSMANAAPSMDKLAQRFKTWLQDFF